MLNRIIASVLPPLLRIPKGKYLSVMNYHRVLRKQDPIRPGEITLEDFEWQMRLISKYFTPLSLRDALAGLRNSTLPKNAICVTFDDGYADNATVALPVMTALGIPLTLFVATGFLNGGRMWNDTIIEFFREYAGNKIDLTGLGLENYDIENIDARILASDRVINIAKYWPVTRRNEFVDALEKIQPDLPKDLMLTDKQLLEMRKSGVEIGAHTVNHPILSLLNMEQARSEINESRRYLESLFGEKIRYFAYPNGKSNKDYLPAQSRILQELGFEAAFTTNWGVASPAADLFQMPRFTPWDKTPEMFLSRLFLNYKAAV